MARTQEALQSQIQISDLFHVYGELLSVRQKTFIELYYDENLSLSEIAERHGISRQAVHDAIKHGRRALDKFEATLHLLTIQRKSGGQNLQTGWRKKVETVLEEMEIALRDDTADPKGRLMAHIASLRELLPQQKEETPAGERFEEEAAA